MLKIGANSYQIVEPQSSLSVTLYPPGDLAGNQQQVWQLTANFVPDGVDYTPPTPWTDEHLELLMRADFYQVKDWRKLSGFGFEDENTDALVLPALTNRLAERSESKELPFSLMDMSLKYEDDFVFHCELDGVHPLPDGKEVELKLQEMLSFKEVVAYVPINSADPVAAAKAMATKFLNLKEFGGHRVTPYDPNRPTRVSTHRNSHHIVTLETAWR